MCIGIGALITNTALKVDHSLERGYLLGGWRYKSNQYSVYQDRSMGRVESAGLSSTQVLRWVLQIKLSTLTVIPVPCS